MMFFSFLFLNKNKLEYFQCRWLDCKLDISQVQGRIPLHGCTKLPLIACVEGSPLDISTCSWNPMLLVV